jgi:hypothetical protein
MSFKSCNKCHRDTDKQVKQLKKMMKGFPKLTYRTWVKKYRQALVSLRKELLHQDIPIQDVDDLLTCMRKDPTWLKSADFWWGCSKNQLLVLFLKKDNKLWHAWTLKKA